MLNYQWRFLIKASPSPIDPTISYPASSESSDTGNHLCSRRSTPWNELKQAVGKSTSTWNSAAPEVIWNHRHASQTPAVLFDCLDRCQHHRSAAVHAGQRLQPKAAESSTIHLLGSIFTQRTATSCSSHLPSDATQLLFSDEQTAPSRFPVFDRPRKKTVLVPPPQATSDCATSAVGCPVEPELLCPRATGDVAPVRQKIPVNADAAARVNF